MLIVRHPEHCPENARGAVVALGNFDGLHLGHQAVLREMKRIAARENAPAAVMTFDPHPREFFNPSQSPLCIYPLAVKERLIKQEGAEILYLLHFDTALASLTAEEFIERLLVEQLGVKHVVTGEDFAFGKGRGGNAQSLTDAAARFGFGYSCAGAVEEGGAPCSSTRIRAALAEGDVAAASRLLGRPYSITGRVQHGDQRGRQLGFPTANIALTQLYTPAHGVYAVRVTLEDGTRVNGVANLGTRPTVGGTHALLEVHCFDLDKDLYESVLETELVARLRAEQKFDGLGALKAQIARDSAQAKTLLESHS